MTTELKLRLAKLGFVCGLIGFAIRFFWRYFGLGYPPEIFVLNTLALVAFLVSAGIMVPHIYDQKVFGFAFNAVTASWFVLLLIQLGGMANGTNKDWFSVFGSAVFLVILLSRYIRRT